MKIVDSRVMKPSLLGELVEVPSAEGGSAEPDRKRKGAAN
jgi:hypothetical protein